MTQKHIKHLKIELRSNLETIFVLQPNLSRLFCHVNILLKYYKISLRNILQSIQVYYKEIARNIKIKLIIPLFYLLVY